MPPESETRPLDESGRAENHSRLGGATDSADRLLGTGAQDNSSEALIVGLWETDLRIRIRRAVLRMELIGIEPEEIDQLGAELAELKRVRACLRYLAKLAP